MKFGYQAAYHRVNQSYFSNDTSLIYRLNHGVPNPLTLDLKPFRTGQRLAAGAARLAQPGCGHHPARRQVAGRGVGVDTPQPEATVVPRHEGVPDCLP